MVNIDVGKNIAITRMSDGSVLSMFNNAIMTADTTIKFYDKSNNVRYTMAIDQTAITNKYRCAYYSRSLPQSAIDAQDSKPRFLLRLTSSSTVEPIYEFISPAIMSVKQDMVQLSWWSNVNSNNYKSGVYDIKSLIRFKSSNLQIDTNIVVYKILCTATIRWEYLRQSGGGVNDSVFKLIPIIDTPVIATAINNQGYVVDFETGVGGGSGGGGSLGIHSHTSNDDAGFAAAVFMPSAHIRPLSWR